MIELDCAQGSQEWTQARLGIPTASRFASIVTPSGRRSSAQDAYMHQLLAERITGEPFDTAIGSGLVMRGAEQEKSARAYYALKTDTEPRQVGFALRDDRRCGCSPDFLIDPNGGGEIKIPGAEKHIGHLLGAEHKYQPQIQGCLWITEREWWDWVCFNELFPTVIVRENRDDAFIAMLEREIGVFLERLEEAEQKLRKMME